jgi:hypothetical protein
MQTLAPGIEVNGIKISPDEINAEVQYHPAESLFSAKYEAMKALVIREILTPACLGTWSCANGMKH